MTKGQIELTNRGFKTDILGLNSLTNLEHGKIEEKDIKALIFTIFSGRKAFVYNYKERCKNYGKIFLEFL